MPNRLHAAGIAALLQLPLRRLRYIQPRHTLQCSPTQCWSAVTIHQAHILRPVDARADGLSYGLFLLVMPQIRREPGGGDHQPERRARLLQPKTV